MLGGPGSWETRLPVPVMTLAWQFWESGQVGLTGGMCHQMGFLWDGWELCRDNELQVKLERLELFWGCVGRVFVSQVRTHCDALCPGLGLGWSLHGFGGIRERVFRQRIAALHQGGAQAWRWGVGWISGPYSSLRVVSRGRREGEWHGVRRSKVLTGLFLAGGEGRL